MALPLLFAGAGTATAQPVVPVDAAVSLAPAPAPADEIDFSADRVSYDDVSALVVAEGQVRMNRDGYYLEIGRAHV